MFDLGRVVIDIDFDRALQHWGRAANCDPDVLRHKFRAYVNVDEAYKLYETGALTDAAYFQHLRSTLGIDIPDAAFLDGWNAILLDEMPGIDGLLRRAKAHMPLYVFSNTNAAHVAHFSTRFRGLLRHFDRVFASSAIGHRKPDPASFEFVAREIGTAPERILFFDDLADNVAGARSTGMQAVHVTDAATVATHLTALGL